MSVLGAREAIARVGANLKRAFDKGEDLDARREMLLASLFGGLALASAGVTACHALAYPLGAFFDIPHGLANAVLLPYIMGFNAESAEAKFAQIGSLLGASESEDAQVLSQAGIGLVKSLSKDIGIPERLRELDVPESDIGSMAEMAMTVARPIENNPRKMTKEAAMRIYEEAF